MLNAVEWLANRILDRPSCTWWNDVLWVAHLDLNEQVTVTRIVVQGSPAIASSVGLGLSSPIGPAIASFGTKLIVAIANPGLPIRLMTSSDGTNFSALNTLPFMAIMPPALAVADDLWLAWVDENFVLHLARSSDGVNFFDKQTSVRVGGPAAIDGRLDPSDGPVIAMAWRDQDSSAAVVTTFLESNFDPALPARVALPDTGIDHVAVAFAIGHAEGGRRILIGCERFEQPQASSRDSRIFARQVSGDLTTVGGLELMPHPGLGPGFTCAPGRIWVTWRDMAERADHLAVGAYDTAFSLPPELEALIGQPCDPRHCPPDLRLACVGTEEIEWTQKPEPAWIRNARKGDLVITPADGAGIIGGFLKELAYEQKYDHMGIMIEDHQVVRHATMAHRRLDAYYTGSVFGEPAPTDGIRSDIVKYGWPGTITQTVQNGFFDGFNDGANPEWIDSSAPPPPPPPGANATEEQKDLFRKAINRFRGFVDPEEQNGERVGYAFANLTWTPQLRPDGTIVEPLVVKPPPDIDAEDPLVRQTLYRVVEAAKKIRGHYRFYAYTDATISQVPALAEAGWAKGTMPVVCSTFIWAAVREASRLRGPQLWLEAEPEATDQEAWRTQVHVIHDGLYRYHQGERRKAAQALYDFTSNEVRSQIWAKMMKLKSEIGWLAACLRWGVATLLTLFAMPLAALASLLSIRLEQAQELTLALSDMPDDVANQICNTFASDQPDKLDDAYWKETGEGVSVAPHDVIWLWDAPSPKRSSRSRFGLWGYPERMILPEPRPERKRKHVYAHSRGLAEVTGKVTYRGTNAPIVGALVRIGCDTTLTKERGIYRIEVASGPQEIVAGTYWPDSKWWLEGHLFTDIVPGANPGLDIVLDDPPEWRRVLQIQIKLDLVHRVLVGHDDWLHTTYLKEHRFVKYPTDWGDPPGGAPPLIWEDVPITSDYAGDERARLKIKAILNPDDLSITVELRGELIEDENAEIEVSAERSTTVHIDETHNVKMSLKSGELPPDRAWFDISILNLREMA